MSKYDLKIDADINAFKVRSEYFIKQQKKVELKAIRKRRTVNQNRYLYALYATVATEFGYTIEEIKQTIKISLGYAYEKDGFTLLKSTAKMNTKELTVFIDKLRNWSADTGLYLPTSEEYLINNYSIDRNIEKNEQYL